MRSILALVIAGTATLASPAMTLAAPILVTEPFAIVKAGDGITPISALTESRSHRLIRTKHAALLGESHLNRSVDSFASYTGTGDIAVRAVRPISPGNPGNAYMNGSFDRSVARHQYNGS